jgi:hypothetical protein
VLGIKPPGYDVDDCLPSITEIKYGWNHTSPLSIRINGVDGDIT